MSRANTSPAAPAAPDPPAPDPPAQPGRTGRPPRTSRAEILEAARRIIDRDGWEKLTIRRLASEVGVGAMTIYHHVRDREDLLVQLINDLTDQIPRPQLPADPRDRIVVVGVAVHDALAAWPWAAEVLTTDGFLSRVGDSALWLVETIVAAAIEGGCTQEQAVVLFRSFWFYTVGEILVRANSGRRRADGSRPAGRDTIFSSPDPSMNALDPAQQPHLAAIGDEWGPISARNSYPQGLRALVDGLFAQAAAENAGAR
ncbi:TetR/AcrR family transcriptional regulator [Pseudonocardia sp. TRM90224]|uniref:TetR/AcrR family transcriptional regulator n=1 Tax=Pseudonocardia sp. TRM90224 TaxID=2812678 RepID=UPI001E4B18F0|nr:TetR/AcrR family transcriptional regulator [Pseudonocardia sp. TRM90224]